MKQATCSLWSSSMFNIRRLRKSWWIWAQCWAHWRRHFCDSALYKWAFTFIFTLHTICNHPNGFFSRNGQFLYNDLPSAIL